MVQKDCPFCERKVAPVRVAAKGRYEVKYEPVQILRDILTCPRCGREIFDPLMEQDNMAQAVETYRTIKNFPSPEELGLCRRRMKMSLKQMAAKLGRTPEEVLGYEDGVLASEKQYRVYRELFTSCGMS